jgi:hypothetical protein
VEARVWLKTMTCQLFIFSTVFLWFCISKCHLFHSYTNMQHLLNLLIKNLLKRRKESDTYLTTVCRHRWSRQITMKVDKLLKLSANTVAFISFLFS